jgi:DNA-binding transcriptional ArsR family regulator
VAGWLHAAGPIQREFDGDWLSGTVKLELSVGDGEVHCSAITVRARKDGPLTARGLRDIPLGAFVRMATAITLVPRETTADGRTIINMTPAKYAPLEVSAPRPQRRWETKRRHLNNDDLTQSAIRRRLEVERSNIWSYTHERDRDGGLIEMHQDGSLPQARQDGLVEEAVGEELLLYDLESHTAHCLSPIAGSVWRHCDGGHDVTELAQLAGVDESLVADALLELREKGLLLAEPELTQSTISGESRREAIVRAARYGAAAAAGSMIVSATAATPAMASSGEEIFEEEKEKKPFMCEKKTTTTNCCLCKTACGFVSYGETECKEKCIKSFGGFIKWEEKAVCKN